MASETPYNCKWGIMATGWIAEVFCKDLLTNPTTRSVTDVSHTIAAVSSSSGAPRAASFLGEIDCPYASDVTTYGTYHELVADPNVDIIYVATPHSHHFQNVMLALEAGKNVLCEKAFTVTKSQAQKLVDTAREKGLFLMEAVWTRYFPLSVKIRELVKEGAIGTVHRVIADLAINGYKQDGTFQWADSHRMVNPDLAGGALLDLGVYSLTWVFQILYHLQPSDAKEAPLVTAAVNKYPTGADESTSVIVSFPKNRSVGIALTSIRVGTDPDGHNSGGPAIRIQGSKGEIAVMGPAYKPAQYKVIKSDGGGKVEVMDCPFPKDPARNYGNGMYWEADECARCLRDGKKESSTLPLDESVVIVGVMEEALKQGGVQYSELITSDVYDAQGSLNTGRK